MNTDFAIAGVRAVLADHIVDRATIVVEDGCIASIRPDGAVPAGAIDGAGLLVVPGLVDTHCDGLEKQIRPRRTSELPIDVAIESFESVLRAAGVTSVFHGLGYQNDDRKGRSIERTRSVSRALSARRDDLLRAVDHFPLYRFEARDPDALDPLIDDLAGSDRSGSTTAMVSFEDHTPGQGQFADVSTFKSAIDPDDLPVGETVEGYVDDLIAEGDRLERMRETNLARLAPLARSGRIRLLAHDVASTADVEAAHDAGAAVAEFPVSIEAARAARERGMTIVMGAPNALRGESHSGNTSARELVSAGLCDVIASDYLPAALVTSVFAMAEGGCCSLPEAVGLVTAGPADMTGLPDRGRLAVGARADLVLIDDRGIRPIVVGVRRADDSPSRRAFG